MSMPIPIGWGVAAAGLTHVGDNSGAISFNTTLSISMPSGLAAGDMILVLASASTNSAITMSTPSGGYSSLYNSTGSGNLRRVGAFYKEADGSETSVSIVVSANARVAGIVRLFRGQTGVPTVASLATGTSTGPNPPSHSPAGGSMEYYWVATAIHETYDPDFTADPSNYDTGVTTAGTFPSSTGHRMRSVLRKLTASTEDPGAFTISTSVGWVASTISIG